MPLVDTSDGLSAMMSKHIATKAKERIDNILTVDTFNKKDLVPLNIVAGTQIDKYRLLSDKSTENVSIDAIDGNIVDCDRAIQKAKARIKKLTGGSGMGNPEDIAGDNGEE